MLTWMCTTDKAAYEIKRKIRTVATRELVATF